MVQNFHNLSMHSLLRRFTIPEHLWRPLLIALGTKVILLFFLLFVHGFVPFATDHYYGNAQFREVSQAQLEDPKYTSTLPFMLMHFDAQWYQQIARDGYNPRGETEEPKNIAFYPLYPLLIWVSGGSGWAALFWSNVFSCGAAVLLYNLCIFLGKSFWKKNEAEQAAFWATVLFMVQPMAVFFLAGYTEGLFLFTVMAAVLAAWKDRPVLTGIAIGCAMITKVQGIILLPVVALALREVRPDKRWKQKDLWILLGIIGFVCWIGYLWFLTGDPLSGFGVQQHFGAGRPTGFNPLPLWEAVTHLDTWHSYRNSRYDVAVTLVTLFLLLLGWKKLPGSLRLYSALMVLIPLSSWSLMSLGRYMMLIFPVSLLLGGWIERRPTLQVFMLYSSILLCSLFAVLYTHHNWVG